MRSYIQLFLAFLRFRSAMLEELKAEKKPPTEEDIQVEELLGSLDKKPSPVPPALPQLPAPNGELSRRPRGRPRKHPLPPSETHPDPDFADLS